MVSVRFGKFLFMILWWLCIWRTRIPFFLVITFWNHLYRISSLKGTSNRTLFLRGYGVFILSLLRIVVLQCMFLLNLVGKTCYVFNFNNWILLKREGKQSYWWTCSQNKNTITCRWTEVILIYFALFRRWVQDSLHSLSLYFRDA